MISPVNNPRITSPYGNRRDPRDPQKVQFHDGIDLVSKDKDTTVRAIAPGAVVFDMDNYREALRWTDPHHSAGNYLIIKHEIGGRVYYFRYLHLGSNTVANGQNVDEGKVIGHFADVGYSFGAHLHLDAYDENWKKIDPTPLVSEVLSA